MSDRLTPAIREAHRAAIRHLNRPNKGDAKDHLSDCKICRHGIFKGRHRYSWHTGNPIGLCHNDCIEGAQ